MFPSGSVAAVDSGSDSDSAGPRSLVEVEGRVAELVGVLNVATAELVDLVADVVEAGEWAGGGYRSVEHWLAVHAGVSPRRARGLVEVANRVEELPETMAKFRAGALAEDQVAPIARHVPAGFEASVAELAQNATASQVARTARSYSFPRPKPGPKPDNDDNDNDGDGQQGDDGGQRDDQQRRRRQSVSFGFDPDGDWWQRAHLPATDGAVVQKALEAARDEIFQERRNTGAGGEPPADAPAVTWADALVRVAEHALAHIAGGKDSRARDRTQVLLHLDADSLDGLDPSDPTAWLHLGPAISRNMARYLACDTDLRLVLQDDGNPVNVGRKYRIVPDHTRRVVENRDRGCRFPGCTNTRWVDCHHLHHWRDGGPTDTTNLCCLCKLHHRLLHLGHITITGNADKPGGLTFKDRWGRTIPNGPQPTPPTQPPPPGHWKHPTGQPLDTTSIWFAQTA